MLARRIKRVLPNVKIIMIIRNPVKRSISQYNMIADRSGTPGQLKKRGKLNGKSFETVVDEDIAAIHAFSDIFSCLLPNATAKLALHKPEKGVESGLDLKVGFNNVWKNSLSELSGG